MEIPRPSLYRSGMSREPLPRRDDPSREVHMIGFRLNGKEVTVEVAADTPLLWVLRDTLGMTGTKFGCGIGECGSCTVHLDGVATRTCMLPISEVAGKAV